MGPHDPCYKSGSFILNKTTQLFLTLAVSSVAAPLNLMI